MPCTDFIAEYPQYVENHNAMDFLSNDGGKTYNLCHCTSCPPIFFSQASTLQNEVWSNFEIADMNFWRSEAYTTFFEYLETKGGFYYEVNVRFFVTGSLLIQSPYLRDGGMRYVAPVEYF